MLAPVLNVNPSVSNYLSFHEAFCSLIHNNGVDTENEVTLIEEDNHGVALRTIDPSTHLNKYVDTVEPINKNKDLEEKLAKVEKKAHQIGTVGTLSKN